MPWYENRSGESLWYEDVAGGCPILLLHGWCMSSDIWKYQRDGFIGSCPDSLRILTPDLRGHGRSRGVSGKLNFDTFATDLVDLFDALDLSKVVLVGWSMGAQIALQSYAEISNRIAGMVLVSATPCFTAADDFPCGLAACETIGMHLKVQRNIERARAGFCTRLFADGEFESHSAELEIRRYLSTILLPDTAAALDALDALSRTDMRHLLPTIGVPTLIINGAKDQICLPQASDYLKAHIARAVQMIFPLCGHAPFMTHSHQFNTEIIRFTRSVCEQDA